MMENKLYPTQFFERISSLDGLRGFSLLGIFLINMMSYESQYYIIIQKNGGKEQINHYTIGLNYLYKLASIQSLLCCLVMG